jgi:hypothetical protein
MEKRKILITTKTYPNISTRYQETVCTAGLLLDKDERPLEWIRLYPIPYRYLDFEKRFKRWAVISALIEKDTKDSRLESFRLLEPDTLETIREINTDKQWQERKNFLLQPHLQFNSIQEIKDQGKSLGIIKPKSVNKYTYEQTQEDWSEKDKAILGQLDLFREKKPLEKIPYKFFYHFTEKNNVPHKFSIIDWEIMELYRSCRNRSKLSGKDAILDALEKVKQKLEDDFMRNKDLYFIVGNLKQHPQNFVIIGIFYPPLVKYNQTSLF